MVKLFKKLFSLHINDGDILKLLKKFFLAFKIVVNWTNKSSILKLN